MNDLERGTSRVLRTLAVLFAVPILALLTVWKGLFFLFVVMAAALVWLLSYKLDWGWYVLAALALMPHWVFRFDDYWWFFTEYPQLLAINAPVVDFWTVALFGAFLLATIRTWLAGKRFELVAPGGGFVALFLISGLVSIINLPSYELSEGFWFFIRFFLLFSFGYFLLGVNIMREKHVLRNTLKILAGVGLAAAVMGAIGFVFHVWGGGVLPRAVPFSIRGWAPFGDQHVFIAEAMTTTLPIWLYLWYTERHAEMKKNIGYGAAFVAIIATLTFSRAGWVTMMTALGLFVLLFRKELNVFSYLKKHRGMIALGAVLTALFIAFMLTTRDVYTSTIARYILTEIAVVLFFLHPFIGHGVGSFPNRADEMLVFHWEIGGVQDAHGIMQKLIAEQGLFGLITFGLMILMFLLPLIRRVWARHVGGRDTLAATLGVFLIVCPLTFQMFNTHIYSSKVWVPIAVAVALGEVYREHKHKGLLSAQL